MINCKINLQSRFGLPTFKNNKYQWTDGSHLSILDNPYISSTLFHNIDRWICIIRLNPSSIKDHPPLNTLNHSILSEIYKEFALLDSEGILLELVFGNNGNALRIIASNEGSIPIYFCQNSNTIYFNWDFKEITTKRRSLILDYEYLIKSTFEPTYSNRTAFQGISMLTAGSTCTFSRESCEYKYPAPELSLSREMEQIDTDEATDLFCSLLRNKTDFQLGQTNKIALELSGGLDSSTVAVTCALSCLSPKLNTYGILVSDPSLVKSQLKRRCTIINHIDASDYTVKIEDHLPILSSPASDKYYLNSEAYGAAFESIWHRAAADEQHIILNGCGGDELFPQFLEEDFSADRLRSIDDHSWKLYNQLLINRLTPKTQDILGSHLLPCAPQKIVDTGMLLAMARRAPLLLSHNLLPLYPFRDNNIIRFCSTLPSNLRVNKTLLSNFLKKNTQSSVFTNYPKETFMHADKIALLTQKTSILKNYNTFKIIEIGLIEKNIFKRDIEQLSVKTPRYVLDYLLNILAIERFLKAYL
ncbi:hypothetical protein PS918_00025 [Pseudomonas fluorescens]|uniref:asparagine synthase (glutamine-hydrolyzing) n=1 Tax=Pseudomonas fluorescens TaxID=294 RepID=A0A5E7QT59_PSEFL|nr:asparagine synthase-related protein [Pseudomonas fluorescens]VVP65059.1 hypothetical protein PS918_00025 [Pseudomonas fluorescens]